MGAHVAYMEVLNTHNILVGKPKIKRPFGKTGRKLDDITRSARWGGGKWGNF
jgi:hypothetical protein